MSPTGEFKEIGGARGIGTMESRSVFRGHISWQAIFAGFFVSLLTYMILMSLGLAVSAGSVSRAIQSGQGMGFGVGSGIWLVVANLVSLFAGGYAAGRVAGGVPIRIGRIQGFVVAALFFAFILTGIGNSIGALGRGVGSSLAALGGAAGDVSQNPQVQDTVERALGSQTNLKSPPGVVAKGLVDRLLRGDRDGARDYLARQAGIPPAQAEQRIQAAQAELQTALRSAGTSAAKAVSVAGWTMFGAFFLGSIASAMGGSLGARATLARPLSRSDEKLVERRGAA